jgi:uncharacterized membrane protein YcaP (DUF421 family)
MLENLWENFIWAIGGGEIDTAIPVWQLVLRTIFVYATALFLIRIAKRRFMGGFTSFDILLGFVVGSIMSRAITGAIRILDMIVAVSVLILLHWILATLTYYFDSVSNIVKDSERELIKDGEIQEETMRRSKIGKNDLLEALRKDGNVEKPENVKSAYLERDGSITVIPRNCENHVVEVKVEDGIQKIEIRIGH